MEFTLYVEDLLTPPVSDIERSTVPVRNSMILKTEIMTRWRFYVGDGKPGTACAFPAPNTASALACLAQALPLLYVYCAEEVR